MSVAWNAVKGLRNICRSFAGHGKITKRSNQTGDAGDLRYQNTPLHETLEPKLLLDGLLELDTLQEVGVGHVTIIPLDYLGRANQGIADSQGQLYTSAAYATWGELYRYGTSWSSSPIVESGTLNADGFYTHVGDIGGDDSYIYAPISNSAPGGGDVDSLYLCGFNRISLELQISVDCSDLLENINDIAGVDVHGGVLYGIEYTTADEGNETCQLITFEDGPSYSSPSAYYTLEAVEANGIAIYENEYGAYAYVSAGKDTGTNEGRIYVYDLNALDTDTVNQPIVSYMYDTPNMHAEGLTFIGDELWVAQADEVHCLGTPLLPTLNPNLSWSDNGDGTVTITDCHEDVSGTLVIPEIIDGKTVVAIGDYAFYDCDSLTSVIITGNLTAIGDLAFYDCNALTNVTIHDSLTTISKGVFAGCDSLASVTMPASVTTIGDWAFYGCVFLTSISIPANVTTISNSVFSGCTSLTSVIIPDDVTTLGSSAFSGCTSLTSVIIPDDVTTLGSSAFSGCTSLTSVAIPDDVTTLGSSVFSGCTSLTSVAIPDDVTTLGSSVFSGCTSLASVAIPANVTMISDSAFSGCTSLTSVAIPGDVTTLGSSAFSGCTSLTSVAIPDDVTTLGSSVFSGCTSLASVDIPAKVTTISDSAFSGCTSLTSVIIPDDVTTLGSSAFSGCTSLVSVAIFAGVTTISDSAFSGCTSLTSVTIPDGVTTIESSAFYGCVSLGSVMIPDSVTTIDAEAFSDCDSLTSVVLGPERSTIDELSALLYYCPSLTNIGVAVENQTYASVDGILFTKDMTTLIRCPRAKISAHMIPGSVVTIGNEAFYGCSDLVIVTIPASVTAIGDKAFAWCGSLTSMIVDASVTTIGYSVFYQSTALGSVILGSTIDELGILLDYCPSCIGIDVAAGNQAYVSIDGVLFTKDMTTLVRCPCGKTGVQEFPGSILTIGEYAFYNCDSLTSVAIPDSVTTIEDSAFCSCGALASVAIPDSVTTIGDSAFYNCDSLTSVAIPDSVTTIEDSAFCSCGALASVTIPDSVTTIRDSVFRYCKSLTSVTIPDSVTTIGDYAFRDCESLTSVAIPDSVTTIGDYAFSGCESLMSVEIGDGVVTIGDSSFSRCYDLVRLTIPDSVMCIGKRAFYWCIGLSSATFEGNAPVTFGEYVFDEVSSKFTIYYHVEDSGFTIPAWQGYACKQVFYMSGMNYVESDGTITIVGCHESFAGLLTIPDIIDGKPVTEISASAFRYYDALTGVTISDSVTTIGASAFSGCSSIASVEIGDSVTEIGPGAFFDCGSLATVEFPDSILTIGHSAFNSCIFLTSVTLGNSVTAIGNYAFSGCSTLANVIFEGDAPASFGEDVFKNVADEFTIYYHVEAGGFTTPTWEGYACAPLADPSLLSYRIESEGTITITDFPVNAFGELIIPCVIDGKPVTAIGDQAFYRCSSLTSVMIPDSIVTIGDYAFANCNTLASIDVSAGNMAYFSQDGILFSRDMTVLIQYPAGKAGDYYAVLDGVATIGDAAFYRCDFLISVTLSASVATIGDYAFNDCSSMTSITFEGDAPISFGDSVFDWAPSGFTVYFYEGASGFTTPTWKGYACEMIAAPLMPGDANGDGSVNLDDFIALKQNYGVSSGATWSMGDFDGNGVVNLDDFILLKQNYGQSISAIGSVPAAAAGGIDILGEDYTYTTAPVSRDTRDTRTDSTEEIAIKPPAPELTLLGDLGSQKAAISTASQFSMQLPVLIDELV